MEIKEIKGALAMSGKEWLCYKDSTLSEIKDINKDLTDQEAEKVFSIITTINKEEKDNEYIG